MEVSSGIIYQAEPYVVYAGKSREDDPLPHYLVVHQEYHVIEYETEILTAAIAWTQHFSSELKKIMVGEATQTGETTQNVLPFPKH